MTGPVGRRRAAALLCGTTMLAALLSACTSDRPDPRKTAEQLAAGLAKHDLKNVPVVKGGRAPQADLERITLRMGAARPKITVGDIDTDGDTATATLKQRWKFEGTDWSYSTPATLTYADDTWRVQWKPSLVAPDLTADEVLRLRTAPADRGDITGAGGKGLVIERKVERIGIDKTRIKPAEAASSARALAKLLDIDDELYVERVKAAGPQAFVMGLRVREAEKVSDSELAAIPGAVQLGQEWPLAPTSQFGQPLLGTVTEATAEMIAKSKGVVQPGDLAGANGLQERYDSQLRGVAGITIEAVAGSKIRELFSSPAHAGKPLRTTLDLDLQGAADKILADVKPASAIVAIRPSSGKIVALSSGPGSEGADAAASGHYAPGSTFKLVTALTFLRNGLKPSSTVPCTPTVNVEGRRFKNYSDYPSSAIGTIPLSSAIANSCNTALIATRGKAPQDELSDAAAALGLGPDVDLGFPAYLGSVPDQAEGTEHAASMIGQGKIQASPLAMAVVAASIAKGSRVTPTLLEASPTKPAAKAAKPLTSGEAKQLQQMFRGVVTEGSGRFLADVPGGPVSAKTGTAEYGTDTPPRTHAWMIATQGDLAVAVFVADGDSGSQTAGPLLEKFLRAAG